MPTTITKYSCNKCKEIYDTVGEASDCETAHAAVIQTIKNATSTNSVQIGWKKGSPQPSYLRFAQGLSYIFKEA